MKIKVSDEELLQMAACVSDNPRKDRVAIAAIEGEIQKLNDSLRDRLLSAGLLAMARADFTGLD
jgi:hypothetical protein